ncbi:hypothetical protein SprV_0902775300 [Sparganum proliferum]
MGSPHLPSVFDVADEAGGGGGAGCHIVFTRGFQDWLAAQTEAADPLQVAQRLTHCCRRHLAAIAPTWMELSREERNSVCSPQQAAWFDELLRLLFPTPKQPSASEALEYFRRRYQDTDSSQLEHTAMSAYLHSTEKLVDDILIGQNIEKTYRDAVVLICLGALLNKHPLDLMEHFSTHENNISRSPSIQNNTAPGALQPTSADTHAVVSRSQTEVSRGHYQIVHQTIANFDSAPSGFRQRTEYTTNEENVKVSRVMQKGAAIASDIARGTASRSQELNEVAIETAGWELGPQNVSRHSTEVSVSFPRSTPRSATSSSESPTFTEPDSNAAPPMRRCSLLPCFTLWKPRSLGKTPAPQGGPTIVIQTSAKDMHARITVSSTDSSAVSESQLEDRARPRTLSFNIHGGVPLEVRLAEADDEERKRRFSGRRLTMEMAEGKLFRSSKEPDSLTEVTSSVTNSQSQSVMNGRTSGSFHLRDGIPPEMSPSGGDLDEEERLYRRSVRLSIATDEALHFLASKIVQHVLTSMNLPTNSTLSSAVSSVTSESSLTEPESLPHKKISIFSADGSPVNSIGRRTTEIATHVVKQVMNTVLQKGVCGSRDSSDSFVCQINRPAVGRAASENGTQHMPLETVLHDPYARVVQQARSKSDDRTIALNISITLPSRKVEIQQRQDISVGAKK